MFAKIGKKQLIVIISIVVAVVIIATAVTIPLVVLNKNGKILFDKLEIPTIEVYEVKGEPDYTVTLGWNQITGAVGYYLEYYYDSDVGDVSFVQDSEVTKKSVKVTTFTFPRQKGGLHFRICACAQNEKYDSGYGEWIGYDVPPLTFELPMSFELSLVTINQVRCYKITESDRNAWSPVEYTYKGETKTVNFYEVCVLSPEEYGKKPTNVYGIFNRSALLRNEYFFNYAGVWTLCIRAVNYGEINGTRVDDLQGYPELKTLFEVNDDWTYIEVTVAEE